MVKNTFNVVYLNYFTNTDTQNCLIAIQNQIIGSQTEITLGLLKPLN